jgi:hypothetical protein
MSGFDDLLGNRSIGINDWTFNFLSCGVRGAQVPAKQPTKQAQGKALRKAESHV